MPTRRSQSPRALPPHQRRPADRRRGFDESGHADGKEWSEAARGDEAGGQPEWWVGWGEGGRTVGVADAFDELSDFRAGLLAIRQAPRREATALDPHHVVAQARILFQQPGGADGRSVRAASATKSDRARDARRETSPRAQAQARGSGLRLRSRSGLGAAGHGPLEGEELQRHALHPLRHIQTEENLAPCGRGGPAAKA